MDLGPQAVQARERRASDDRAVAIEGDDCRVVEGLGLGGADGDGIGSALTCDGRAPASGRHRDRSAALVRAITDQAHRRVTLLMPPVGSLRTVGDGRCSRSRAASQGVSQRAATLLAGHHRHWSETSADVAFPGRLGAQVAGAVGGPQEAPQDGTVRARGVLGSHLPGDVLGDDVGLLCGQPALLVGAGRRIADREDIVVVGHPEGVVDGDEAVGVAGDARAVGPGPGAGGARPGRTSRPAPARELHARRMRHGRLHAREQLDPGGVERRARPLAGRGAEGAERLGLGGDQRQLCPAWPGPRP